MKPRIDAEERESLRRKYEDMKLFPGPAKEARDMVLTLLSELDAAHSQQPLSSVGVRASAPRVIMPPPAMDEVWTSLEELRKLVEADDPDGTDFDTRMSYRALEVSGDAGCAAGAWAAFLVGGDYTKDDVAAYFAGTAITALVALSTLRPADAARYFARHIGEHIATLTPEPESEEDEEDTPE